MPPKKIDTRTEKDSLSEVNIPISAYWGIGTSRYLDSLKVTDLTVDKKLVEALTQVKKACATVNSDLGYLEKEYASAIIESCDRILTGELIDQIVVDAFHGAGGSGLNTNLNEVIANYANQILGHALGTYSPINPDSHVNLNHSINDSYITAMRISILTSTESLSTSLLEMERMLRRKSLQFDRVIKPGRIFMQDSVPITLGQELNACGSSIEKSLRRLKEAREIFREINLGGGEIGTGYNIAEDFHERIIRALSLLTKEELKACDDYVRMTSQMTDFAHFSSCLKELTLDLEKIATDLKILSSGPYSGIREIFTDNQTLKPGEDSLFSSRSPYVETVFMVCNQVKGNDLTVSCCSSSSMLEGNGTTPLIIHKILESISLLARAIDGFSKHCLSKIEADISRCQELTQSTEAFVQLIASELGAKKAREVVKQARNKNQDVKEYLIGANILSQQRIEAIFSHRFMTSPKLIIPFKNDLPQSPSQAPVGEDKSEGSDS